MGWVVWGPGPFGRGQRAATQSISGYAPQFYRLSGAQRLSGRAKEEVEGAWCGDLWGSRGRLRVVFLWGPRFFSSDRDVAVKTGCKKTTARRVLRSLGKIGLKGGLGWGLGGVWVLVD